MYESNVRRALVCGFFQREYFSIFFRTDILAEKSQIWWRAKRLRVYKQYRLINVQERL